MSDSRNVYVEYAVIGTLGIFAFSQLMILVVNPESFFWGLKLAGLGAQGYMIGLVIVAVSLIVLLLAKVRAGPVLCTLFYGYVVAETVWSNYVVLRSVTVGPLPLIGLLVSVVLWFLKRSSRSSTGSDRSL